MMLQAAGIFVGRIETQHALSANDGIGGDIGRPEAARESCSQAPGKPKSREKTFFYFTESRIAAIFSRPKYFFGLGPEQITGGVDAIDSDIVQRASTLFPLQTNGS